MDTGDTAPATSPLDEVAALAQSFAALRQPETEPTPEVPAAPVAETVPEVAPPEKQRFKIGELELDEDAILEAHRSGLRQEDYTKKTMAHAEQVKKEKQELAQARADYAEKLKQVEELIAAQNPKEPDWATLRSQVSADEFIQRVADWKVFEQQRNALTAEREQAERAAAEDRKAHDESVAQSNYKRVLTLIPEWENETTRKQEFTAMVQYAKTIEPDLPESVLLSQGPAFFKMLRDAMQYHALRQSTEKPKVVKVDAKTLTPGANPTTVPKASEVETAARKLKQSGKEEDLVGVFREYRKIGAI